MISCMPTSSLRTCFTKGDFKITFAFIEDCVTSVFTAHDARYSNAAILNLESSEAWKSIFFLPYYCFSFSFNSIAFHFRFSFFFFFKKEKKKRKIIRCLFAHLFSLNLFSTFSFYFSLFKLYFLSIFIFVLSILSILSFYFIFCFVQK